MHYTAMEHGRLFFETYVGKQQDLTIVDIGSQDVNGSLRSAAPSRSRYIGVDFVSGSGVDVILDDPYKLPIDDNTADVVVSSSCLEHSEFFWLLFLELLRVTKPSGLIYLNAPSNGDFHRYPVDCWRFYPDCGMALARWGQRNGYPVALMESFIGRQKRETWNDFVAVFVRDEAFAKDYPERMVNELAQFTNGVTYEAPENVMNLSRKQQDQEPRVDLRRFVKRKLKRLYQ